MLSLLVRIRHGYFDRLAKAWERGQSLSDRLRRAWITWTLNRCAFARSLEKIEDVIANFPRINLWRWDEEQLGSQEFG